MRPPKSMHARLNVHGRIVDVRETETRTEAKYEGEKTYVRVNPSTVKKAKEQSNERDN